MTAFALEFFYPWWLTSGHLLLFTIGIVLLLAAWRLHAPRALRIVLGVFTTWAGVAALLVHFFGINTVPALPTESFLRSDTGRVLDLGAGTGRSSIMVLTARPHVTLVASDLFGESFEEHFGPSQRPQDRLQANLDAAGVGTRASIATADMRKLPFETASFDALVSAYAMDHLGRAGAQEAMGEARRVIKPGGDFLLILVHDDWWTRFLFGPLLAHGGFRGAAWWRQLTSDAGFDLVEEGTSPATIYFLLRARH